MAAMLSNIRIVLVNTSHPGNIGSAARAMKTMGLSKLYLVKPKKFPHSTAIDLAAGADDIVNGAQIVESLADAVADCKLVIGTSARPRGIELPGLSARECGQLTISESQSCDVALVFGREHAGLTNEELMICNYHVMIASNPDYSSLNLAQAVQVLAYECRISALERLSPHKKIKDDVDFADAEQMTLFYQHLKKVLIDIEFLKPSNPKKLMQRLKRLFNRARLESNEVNILRGIFTNIERKIRNK